MGEFGAKASTIGCLHRSNQPSTHWNPVLPRLLHMTMKTLAAVVRNHSSEVQILLNRPPEVGYQEGHPKASVPNHSLVHLYSSPFHSNSNVLNEKSSTIQFLRDDSPNRFLPTLFQTTFPFLIMQFLRNRCLQELSHQLMIEKILYSFPPDRPLDHRAMFSHQATAWVQKPPQYTGVSRGRAAASNQKRCRNFSEVVP